LAQQLSAGEFRSHGFIAVLAASVGSSVLGFVMLVAVSSIYPAGNSSWTDNLPATIAIVVIWVPAFALIPAGILGFVVERPKARAMIERRAGGFAWHMLLSVAAAALLSFLLRIALHLANPMYPLLDSISLALFTLVGFCSGIAWWFLVVLPGRRG
jgi:hypothetical protein